MKLYIAALLASAVFAQQDGTQEPASEPAAEETPEDIVTELAWTDRGDKQNTSGNWWTYLTQSSTPQGLSLATSGTVTCMTDADGASSLKTEMRGSWALQWRQTSGNKNNDVFTAGLVFSIGQTVVDGSVSTTTGEYWATGGSRNKQDRENLPAEGNALNQTFVQRAIANGETATGFEWNFDVSEFASPDDAPLTAWTLDYSRAVEAVTSGRKYIQGIEASATRAFGEEGDDFSLKNKETYQVWSAVWVADSSSNKAVNYGWGSQDWMIDMPVPEVPTTEFCPDGVTEKVEGTECPKNAIALGVSALTAAAMLLISF